MLKVMEQKSDKYGKKQIHVIRFLVMSKQTLPNILSPGYINICMYLYNEFNQNEKVLSLHEKIILIVQGPPFVFSRKYMERHMFRY